jgi:hypothetical protein
MLPPPFVTAESYGRTRLARMRTRERHILEQSVHAVAEQAAKADDLVDEAIEVRAWPLR